MRSNKPEQSKDTSEKSSQHAAGGNAAKGVLEALNAPSSMHQTDPRTALVRQAGGIVIGKDELVKIGYIPAGAKLPQIPAKYSEAFLNAKHPLREGTIASHVILGFDVRTLQWHCFEKSVVPESFNLSGDKQDQLLRNNDGSQIEVQGVRISSPQDSAPIVRLLDCNIGLMSAEDLASGPFCGIWARTADTERANDGCRIILSTYFDDLISSKENVPSHISKHSLGLLAGWD